MFHSLTWKCQASIFNRSMRAQYWAKKHLFLCLFYTTSRFASHHCDTQGVYQIEVNLFTVVHDNGSVRGHKQHIVSLGPFFIKEANVKYKTIINCKKRGLFPKRTIGNLFSCKELKSRTGQGSAVLNMLH